MKKLFLAFVMAAALSWTVSAEASFVSTLDFYGFFHYDDRGGLDPDTVFCDAGFGRDCGMTQVDPPGGEAGGYTGLGAIAYTLDINLPETPQELPYWLEISLEVDGIKEEIGGASYVIDFDFDDMFDLGPLTLPPDSVVEAGAESFFDSIPPGGSIGGLNFEFEGDSEAGAFLFGFSDQIDHLSNKTLWLDFNGNVTLTGHTENNVIPEPSTMFLVGGGLLGLFGRRRKKA